MNNPSIFLVLFCISIFFVFIYVTPFSILTPISVPAYSTESSINDSSLHNKFLTYYNPFTMIKIQYPSFWETSEIPDSDIVLFSSPLESTGVIVQNMSTHGKSADEILTNLLVKIRSELPRASIINTTISQSDDGSTIQALVLRYGDGPTQYDIYKAFIVLKTSSDKTFVFAYQSEESLFDLFFPLASQMYRTYQVQSFTNVFPTSIYSIDSIASYNPSNETNPDRDNFLTYKNKSLGLEIQYPASLDKTELDSGVMFTFSNKTAGVTFTTSKLDSTLTSDYARTHLLYLNKSLDNFNILDTLRSDEMGDRTPKIVFTYDNNTELYKGLQFWKIKDNRVHFFTFFASAEEEYDELLPIVNRMAETLKIP
jgi:hypothetical protein